jgi:TonB family protein
MPAVGVFESASSSAPLSSGRRTVASSGFTSAGTATESPAKARARQVQQVTFNQAPVVAVSKKQNQVQQVASTSAVVIESKAVPVYSDEGRRLRIEGEVLLHVIFGSDGRVRVTGVVRGLGHGLDEAAAQAAQRIRFRPAERDGAKVDAPATLHIVFALS